MAKLRRPDHLQYAATRRLWDDTTSTYDLRPDEVAILEAACRARDRVEVLERVLRTADLLVAGSKGQLVMHPAAQEVRLQQDVMRKLLNQLGLPDEPGSASEGKTETRSEAARRAARARWGTDGGA